VIIYIVKMKPVIAGFVSLSQMLGNSAYQIR